MGREAQQWNRGQLEQWAAVAGQREEDNLALQQYQRQDEALIKQLNRELERYRPPFSPAMPVSGDLDRRHSLLLFPLG